MKWLHTYVAYLKNNPEGYWFKRKLWGWGWTPATWQGWLIMLVAIGGIIYLATGAESVTPEDRLSQVILPIAVIVVILLLVTYWKGEAPRWQWGLPKESQHPIGNSLTERIENYTDAK